jgi:hypothetical protein
VVPGDRDDGDPRLVQSDQGLEDERVGLRRRGSTVVDVAGQQERVHAFLPGDADDLPQDVAELFVPRAPPDGAPNMPIAGVEEPHRRTSVPPPRDRNHMHVILRPGAVSFDDDVRSDMR